MHVICFDCDLSTEPRGSLKERGHLAHIPEMEPLEPANATRLLSAPQSPSSSKDMPLRDVGCGFAAVLGPSSLVDHEQARPLQTMSLP